MTTLHRLAVQGIRSYDSDNASSLEFFHPLTIIVGANGSGKTTLIEALRFASCGQEPPDSDRGKSFVQDLDLSGSSSVKAKVQLAFRREEEQVEVIVRRHLQVSRIKGGKRTLKNLDATVSVRQAETGEVHELSKKCAEIDEVVPRLMQISPALLQNVVFCHQEESFWPLYDDRRVKDKFDDIFAATPYSKALVHIKAYRKELAVKAKDFKHSRELLAKDMDKVNKLKEDLKALNFKIKAAALEISKLDEKIDARNLRIQQLKERVQESKRIESQISLLEQQVSQLSSENRRLKERIEMDFEEDDLSSLLKYKERKASSQRNAQSRLEISQRLLKEVKSQKQDMEKIVVSLSQEVGKIEGCRHRNARSKTAVIELVRKIFDSYMEVKIEAKPILDQLREPQKIQPSQISPFITALSKLLNKKKFSLDAEQQKFNEEEASIDIEINEINLRLASLNETLRRAQEEADKQRTFLEKIKEEEREMNSSQNSQEALESENLELTTELSKLEFKMRELDLDNKLALNLRKFEEYNEKQKHIESRIEIVKAKMDMEKEFQLCNDRLDSQKFKVRQKVDKYNESCSIPELSLTKLEKSSLVYLSEKCKQIIEVEHNAEREVMKKQSELESFRERLKEQHDILSVLEEEMATKEKLVLSALQKGEEWERFPLIINELKNQVSDLQLEESSAEYIMTLYNKCISHAETNGQCRICDRPMTKSEIEEHVRKMNFKISEVKERPQNGSAYEISQLRLQKMMECQHHWKRVEEIKSNELNASRGKLKNLESRVASLSIEVSQAKDFFESAKSRSEMARISQTRLGEILSLLEDQVELESQKIMMETKFPNSFSAVSEHEMLQIELSESMQRSRECRIAYDSLSSEQRKLQLEINRLREKLYANQSNQASLSARVVKFGQVEERKKEARDIFQRETEMSNRTHEQISAINLKLMDLRNKKETRRNNLKNSISALQAETTHISSSLQKISDLADDLKASEEQLVDYELLVQKLESERTRLEELNVLELKRQEEFDESSGVIKNFDDILRNLSLMIEFREKEESISGKARELAKLRSQLSSDQDSSLLMKEFEKLTEVQNQESQRRSEFVGSRRANENLVSDLERQLLQLKVNDLEKAEQDALIQFETCQCAIEDLDRYYTALDNALMGFHAQKMEEINSVLKELWQTTYRNRDIDYIAIKSNLDEESRKQYTYRVVMIKGNQAIPMRGQCSAGQRVLACILIRMALAESFCVKCGILALDEPTTNLDSRNIRALADSLNELIKRRKGQKSFQLIIITHDQDFVKSLHARDHADNYYLIEKDDRQHSVIRLQKLPDLG